MLEELRIKNYALIDDITVRFGNGLNVLTGETGAGKSIIVEALGLLIGDRASSAILRKDASCCTITGVFSIAHAQDVIYYLEQISIPLEEDSIIIRREVSASGKSRCYINDHPVNLGTLLNIGELLVDIHGQHEHQSLLKNSKQRDMLDRYGKLEEDRDHFGKLYAQYQHSEAAYEAHALNEKEKARRIDLYRFQCEEIQQAQLKIHEEEELETLLPKLKYADKLSTLADQAQDILYRSDGSVKDQLVKLKGRIESINQVVGEFGDIPSLLDEMVFNLEEFMERLERFSGGLAGDPGRIDRLLGRQDLIEKLKRKYGNTVEEILDYESKIQKELEFLENFNEKKSELLRTLDEHKEQMTAAGKKLSHKRKKAASRYAESVQKELRQLGMPKALFHIDVKPVVDDNRNLQFSSTGADAVEFFISSNPGELPAKLTQVASGGEISRVMLALKTVAARDDRIPLLIFDEIDAGIGGSTGTVVGKKLHDCARSHQVIVITHLPQIASYAETHLRVVKQVDRQQTRVAVHQLSGEERTREIASMLGGKGIHDISLKHAEHILRESGGTSGI